MASTMESLFMVSQKSVMEIVGRESPVYVLHLTSPGTSLEFRIPVTESEHATYSLTDMVRVRLERLEPTEKP